MQFDWMSSIISFVVGTVAGASGMYYAEKLTDWRRIKESKKERKKDFLNAKAQMPELIREMKTDLSKEDHRLIREFFILPNKRCCIGFSGKPRFSYYEEDHKSLRGKIDLLESKGFLSDVTIGNTPIYRMTEEFVELINKYE
jgi:hypothetical protein